MLHLSFRVKWVGVFLVSQFSSNVKAKQIKFHMREANQILH